MNTKILSTIALGLMLLLTNCGLASAKPTPQNTVENTEKIEAEETIKVALLLDTSNSMDGLINQTKTQLWEIVNELSYAKCGTATPNLEIALYEYGNDGLSIRNGHIRRVLHFTNDLDEISEKLFALKTNGGSEYCGQVIQTSLSELEWGKNKKDLKMVFIAGNEPFTQGNVNYKDAITDAREKGITVNTIFCGNFNTGVNGMWKDGALLGGGDYLNIDQNKEIVHIVTPYDKEIIILNKRLNKTYIYYGSQGRSKYDKQAVQDDNASGVSEEVMVKRSVSKSSRLYSNSSWDLVDAEKDNKADYKKLNKAQLPKHLQNKSEAELKTYVQQQLKKREGIQKEIQELNKKRRTYVANKQKENSKGNELESVLIKAIKRQAKTKNYTW